MAPPSSLLTPHSFPAQPQPQPQPSLQPVSARVRQWLLASGFAVTAIIMPLCSHGTEAGNAAWAWFLFFALQSLLVLSDPSIFLS